MGKIRVKTLGDTEAEEKQAQDAKKRKEAKKQAKGPAEAEPQASVSEVTEENASEEPKKAKKEKFKNEKNKPSKRFALLSGKVDPVKTYALTDAVALVKEVSNTKFDSTIELHINTMEKGVSGQVTLPHGTGKEVRVAIADGENAAEIENLIKKVESGSIEFDVLIATPSAMPKLAKIARVLGPRGLMPNPKNGTITEKVDEAAKKFTSGQINFKTESQAPIIHTIVGKASFEEKQLVENIKEFISAVGGKKIRNITLKSSMSPAIKLQLTAFL